MVWWNRPWLSNALLIFADQSIKLNIQISSACFSFLEDLGLWKNVFIKKIKL